MRLSKLQSTTIDDWRNRLPVRTPGAPVPREEDKDESLTPSSINRLLNDLRAALNKAGLKRRRELVGRGLSTG
jgi:hypothetical protein